VRRWFHCLLIGVLTCSLSVDTAKACWYLRRAHAACGYSQPACPPVATWPGCHEVVIRDFDCGGGMADAPVVIVDGWHDDSCCADGGEPVVVTESIVQPHESVVAVEPTPATVPTPAEPIVQPEPAPETGVAAVAPAVPELQPAVDARPAVETVVALEPAPAEPAAEPVPVEPAPEPAAVQPSASEPELPVTPPSEPAEPEATPEPQPAPEAVAAEPPAPPAEPNLFEEVEAAADAAILAPADPDASQPAADAALPATEPQADNLFGEPAPATDPAAEPAPPASEPAADAVVEPAAEPESDPAAGAEPGPAPAAEPPAAEAADPFSDASREPARRWVDDTGSYTIVGVLVDVRAEGVEIRKANGRTVIVPLERLSEHDRGYAAAAGARLAAERAPAARETAGL
jgi:hypothetical protein